MILFRCEMCIEYACLPEKALGRQFECPVCGKRSMLTEYDDDVELVASAECDQEESDSTPNSLQIHVPTIWASRRHLSYDDEQALPDLLGAMIDAFEKERREGSHISAEDLQEHDEIAQHILDATSALVGKREIPSNETIRADVRKYKSFVDLLQKERLAKSLRAKPSESLDEFCQRRNDVFREVKQNFESEHYATRFVGCTSLLNIGDRFAIEMAREAIWKSDDAANRLFDLWSLTIDALPKKACLQFLRAISRTYVWGFDGECVILCRGALDTAFREAVDDELCTKHGESPTRYGFTMVSRIWAAFKAKMIDEHARDAALGVNDRADKNVHDSPDATPEILGTIRDTLSVVGQVCPAK